MGQQTAVEWLQERIFNSDWKNMNGEDKLMLFEEAKEMEKQQIIDAFDEGQEYEYEYHVNSAPKFFSDTYYAETYGSKGSDEYFKQFSLYEHKETITSADIKKAETMGLYDKIELTNPNDSIFTSSQTEISDEEIEKEAEKRFKGMALIRFLQGAKYYREQLKKKQ